MLIDEKIELRNQAYKEKNYVLSDSLRSELDNELVFIFDYPDGTHDVYYLTNKYFDKMGNGFKSKRKYVEHKLKKNRQAEQLFNAWLISVNSSIKNGLTGCN